MQYIHYHCDTCFRINSLGTHDNNIASLEAFGTIGGIKLCD